MIKPSNMTWLNVKGFADRYPMISAVISTLIPNRDQNCTEVQSKYFNQLEKFHAYELFPVFDIV